MEGSRDRAPTSPVNGRARAERERAESILLALTECRPSRRIAAMRAAGMALLLYLAAALGAAPAIRAAEAEEPGEGEVSADEAPTPKIYKWVDEHGIAHYTTDFKRIPEPLRDRVGKLGPPDAALTRSRVEAGAPPIRPPAEGEVPGGATWAVRDRAYEGPTDIWDAGDPYADAYGAAAAPGEPGESAPVVSEAQREEQRRYLEELDERIASLRTDIAESEEALKLLVAIPVPEGGGALAMADDPGFREAASRLPKLLAELRALEDERAQLEAP
jgi:hypothetical protein